MVILDTNIIIDHLRSSHSIKSKLLQLAETHPKANLAISFVTIQELYEGRSTRDGQKEKDLLAVISPLKLLPYTYEIAQIAGTIARDLDQPIELADAAIAATAIQNHCELFTLNTKDFRNISGLELFSL